MAGLAKLLNQIIFWKINEIVVVTHSSKQE
jgi:hypothetical protein